MIVKAYHIEHKCNDAPKFASALPSSAVELKNCRTMYCGSGVMSGTGQIRKFSKIRLEKAK